jgi:hypothetical protein
MLRLKPSSPSKNWWRILFRVGLVLEAAVDAVPVGEKGFFGDCDAFRDLDDERPRRLFTGDDINAFTGLPTSARDSVLCPDNPPDCSPRARL